MHSYRSHIKQTIQLAYPVAIGQLGHIMMAFVDNLMVGKTGAAPLAAGALANGIFFIVFVIGLGVSFAVSPLIAISVGAQKTEECNDILKNSFWVNMCTGFVLFLILYFGADLIYYLHQPQLVASLAVSFLRIISFSVFPMMVFQTYRQFVEGFSIMRPAMFITIFGNIANAFGNWLLIYGNWGCPSLGLDGSGLSTLFNRIVMAVLMVLYVTKSDYFKKFDLNISIRNLNYNIIKRILRLGLPSGFQFFFEVGAFSGTAIMVGWIGTDELAAHEIALNLASITYMTITGIAAAASIRVGNAVGQGNVQEVRKAGFSALILSGSIMGCFGILFIIFNKFLPAIYVSDSNVIRIASSLLIITAVFEIFDGTQAIGQGILRGITDVKIPTLITFFAYWILSLPAGYIFAFKLGFGLYGIWYGFVLGLAVIAVLLALRFNYKSKYKVELK